MPVVRLKVELEATGTMGNVFPKQFSLACTEALSFTYQLATATTDQAVPQNFTTGITTATVVAIYSDKTISWKQVAADTAGTITAGGMMMLFNTSVTALVLSNASGSTANVTFFLAG